MTYVGVDPGRRGGLCVLSGGSSVLDPLEMDVTSMPDTRRDLLDWLFVTLAKHPSPYRCTVEQVSGFMGNRSKGKSDEGEGGGNTGHTMFVFGQNYGECLMALDALHDLTTLDLKYVTVVPNVWQRGLGIPPKLKTERPKAYKRRLKEFACQLFPQKTLTLLTADASLLAAYSRSYVEW
jgi:hypothetical protein